MPRQKHSAAPANHSRIFIRIVLGLILVLAVSSAVAIYFEQETQLNRMLDRRANLERQLEAARVARDELAALKNIVDTDEYIERVAREKLGMVRPNEVIFEE